MEEPPVRLKYLVANLWSASSGDMDSGSRDARVVGHVDDGLLGTTDQLGLILQAQHDGLMAPLADLSRGVNHLDQDLAGEPLVAVLAAERELDGLAPLQVALEPGHAADPEGLRPVPYPLAPALEAAVQGVRAVVRGERVRVTAVHGVDLGARDAVRDAADRLAEEGPVVRHVELLRREALDDILAADFEGLDDGAQGQEGYFVGHFLDVFADVGGSRSPRSCYNVLGLELVLEADRWVCGKLDGEIDELVWNDSFKLSHGHR